MNYRTMRVNLVFNMESIDELDNLVEALKEVATLQAKLQLEQEIRLLVDARKLLIKEIDTLRTMKNELKGTSQEESSDTKKTPSPEFERATPSSSLQPEAQRIIEAVTNESTGTESTTRPS